MNRSHVTPRLLNNTWCILTQWCYSHSLFSSLLYLCSIRNNSESEFRWQMECSMTFTVSNFFYFFAYGDYIFIILCQTSQSSVTGKVSGCQLSPKFLNRKPPTVICCTVVILPISPHTEEIFSTFHYSVVHWSHFLQVSSKVPHFQESGKVC